MTAVDRGKELLHTQIKKLPPICWEFAGLVVDRYGKCAEAYLTAYAIYAQIVEGLSCEDPLYQPRPIDREWFAARGYPGKNPEPAADGADYSPFEETIPAGAD